MILAKTTVLLRWFFVGRVLLPNVNPITQKHTEFNPKRIVSRYLLRYNEATHNNNMY